MEASSMELADGSRIGVVGGGPSGSMTSYFMLETARRVGLELSIDIYEPRDYTATGPRSCNMCGGIVSESLVQLLATEGINLPASVVRRGLESYTLYADSDTVRIDTPVDEQRIAALYRGGGPRGSEAGKWGSFDGFLLDLACEQGACCIPTRVEAIGFENGRPWIRAKGAEAESYDLLVGAVGVNTPALKLFTELGVDYRQPQTTRAFVAEMFLGRDKVQEHMGNSMHVFLSDIARLEFAALIPKSDYVTVCLLGHKIDRELVNEFMNSPDVQRCLPEPWDPKTPACSCQPQLNIAPARHFFDDRVVLVGDCGVTRLYKDGIGAAYRAAKACATTAVFHGVSKQDFRKHYWPTCRRILRDNRIGKIVFLAVAVQRKLAFLRRAMMNMVRREQNLPPQHRLMSMALWDTFTGSAPYRTVLGRSLSPRFIMRFTLESLKALFGRNRG